MSELRFLPFSTSWQAHARDTGLAGKARRQDRPGACSRGNDAARLWPLPSAVLLSALWKSRHYWSHAPDGLKLKYSWHGPPSIFPLVAVYTQPRRPGLHSHFSAKDSRNISSDLSLCWSSKRTIRGWTMLEMWRRLAGISCLCLLMLMCFTPEAGKKYQISVFFPGLSLSCFCLFVFIFKKKIISCFCSGTGRMLLFSVVLDGKRREFFRDWNILIWKFKSLSSK